MRASTLPQSLANVLVVLRRRLGELQKAATHTSEDLAHYQARGRSVAGNGGPPGCTWGPSGAQQVQALHLEHSEGADRWDTVEWPPFTLSASRQV